MGLFSPRKKKITFLVMVGLSGQPLSDVWGVLRSTQSLTTLAEYGLAHDENSLQHVSNSRELSHTYLIPSRPGATIQWCLERFEEPGWVTIIVEGDQAAIDDARTAFTEIESLARQELRGLHFRVIP
jgi:hypothetical protein